MSYDDPEITLRLGTRGSLLARTQSMLVADLLERCAPGVRVEMRIVKTTGDQITDRPLHDSGGKGLFTKELEQALLDDEIDFAVHSFKDVPVTMPLVDQSDLVIAAVPAREDPRDVLASPIGSKLKDLRLGARVGTSSLRRRCQILAQRPNLRIEPIRGNIDTRLRKMHEGQYNAVVLAVAGLKRAKLFDPTLMKLMPVEIMLPAAGQGALALQCRRSDEQTREVLSRIDHEDSAACVQAERNVVEALEGDCHSPIAVLAQIEAGEISIQAAVGARDGGLPVIRAQARESREYAESAVAEVYQSLLKQGAAALLAGDG